MQGEAEPDKDGGVVTGCSNMEVMENTGPHPFRNTAVVSFSATASQARPGHLRGFASTALPHLVAVEGGGGRRRSFVAGETGGKSQQEGSAW